MKRIAFFIVLISINLTSIFAYEVKVDTVFSICNNSQLEQLIISIDNNQDTLWIWVDSRKEVTEKSQTIRRFLMNRNGGDFSIYDIATDPNMQGCWWKEQTPIQYFLKCLMPKHRFTIVLYRERANKEKEGRHGLSSDIIKIYKQKEIDEYCSGMYPSVIMTISYPYDVFIYPIKETDNL